MSDRPKTYGELFAFYDTYVKLLYGSVQANNSLPVEVLFEINAAFDHLSRAWIYNESEEDVIYKAHAHLKRSCLDIFKLRTKVVMDQYAELKAIDTSIIDNGEFDSKMRALAHEIKTQAAQARKLEGRSSFDDYEVPSFALWQPVFEKCSRFEKDFYLHPSIEWAKKKNIRLTIRETVVAIITTALGGALSYAFLEEPLGKLIKYLFSHH